MSFNGAFFHSKKTLHGRGPGRPTQKLFGFEETDRKGVSDFLESTWTYTAGSPNPWLVAFSGATKGDSSVWFRQIGFGYFGLEIPSFIDSKKNKGPRWRQKFGPCQRKAPQVFGPFFLLNSSTIDLGNSRILTHIHASSYFFQNGI